MCFNSQNGPIGVLRGMPSCLFRTSNKRRFRERWWRPCTFIQRFNTSVPLLTQKSQSPHGPPPMTGWRPTMPWTTTRGGQIIGSVGYHPTPHPRTLMIVRHCHFFPCPWSCWPCCDEIVGCSRNGGEQLRYTPTRRLLQRPNPHVVQILAGPRVQHQRLYAGHQSVE